MVQQYLDRIKAYDQQGPILNAILCVNPKVLEQADALDKQLKRGTKEPRRNNLTDINSVRGV
jgi:Asp-tRNA(Asn)/Glu-tRNA(Gln) amidotransferase A subunit family amidase